MLKRRIAATVVVKDGIAVQSIGFSRYLPLGRPEIAVEFLDRWGVDEIFLIDITASRLNREPDENMVRRVAKCCHVPLTVAGGIKSTGQMGRLLSSGADKVAINQAARKNYELLTEAAMLFGNQCVVASIDVATDTNDGTHQTYDYISGKIIAESPTKQAKQFQDAGAGEILLNSVDRDGSYSGFDIRLIRSVVDAVSVPVIGLGGAGRLSHFTDTFHNTDVSALAAGNIFHFWEHSVAIVKSSIALDIPIRRETNFAYADATTDPFGRLEKKCDQELEQMLYVQIEPEVI